MNFTVSSIMSTGLITVNKQQTMKDVEDLFYEHNIHHLPVIGEGELQGMVSYSDYLFFKRGFTDYPEQNRDDLFRLKTHKVKDIMETDLTTLPPSAKISQAIEIFKLNHFHAIPITIDSSLIGLVTTYDMMVFYEKKLKEVYDGYKNLW